MSTLRSQQDSGADREIQVIKFFEQLGTSRRGIPMATPVEKFLNRPFPGTKLDVPRLAAPRGPARGRARANRPGRSYRMSVYHSSGHRSVDYMYNQAPKCIERQRQYNTWADSTRS